jgi:hypothetical protein
MKDTIFVFEKIGDDIGEIAREIRTFSFFVFCLLSFHL